MIALALASVINLNSAFGAQPPWGTQPSHILWSPDSKAYLYDLPTQNPFAPLSLYEYDTATGSSRVLIDPAKYGKKAKSPSDVSWSPDSKSVAFSENGTLYVRDLATNMDRAVDKDAGDPQWSPDSRALAYVKDADLYAAVLGPKLTIRRLTSGGKEDEILNGELDWVYPEELGTEHGFAWSPDSKVIAYMQMDERKVTDFPIVDFLTTDNTVKYQRYPLAGENNPRVSLHVVDASGGGERTVYDAGATDTYLPFFGWKPKSETLIAETLDRSQRHLRVYAWRDATGKPGTLYAQDDAKWVGADDPNGDVVLPTWLSDGRSLWVLDRDGDSGLYLRSADGALRRLTGAYRTFALDAIDKSGAYAYIEAAYPTRRDHALLRVDLQGHVVNLTPAPGSHETTISPDGALFVDEYSTLNDPPRTDLVASASRKVFSALAPENQTLRAALLPTQMLAVPSKFGPLDAIMIKPPDFDAAKKYPVIVYVYGGPTAPTTGNGFDGMLAMYHQLLARRGFIVFSIDGPASQIDSDAHVQLLYHNFGPGSLMGQVIGVNYLKSLPYVDPSRIGIWGWSFGGYETVYALTHTDLFKAGAAVAPVTDWHYYDTIYTERYMGKPQDDPSSYDTSSNVKAAASLHGDLLISHGTSDDNVHMANTVSLLQAFIDADKTHVDVFLYPRRTHSIAGVPQRRHLFQHMLEWWTRHL